MVRAFNLSIPTQAAPVAAARASQFDVDGFSR
jgi:hypothetical protein